MSVYAGIEKVDPIERLKQHEITKVLWRQLCEKGVRKGDKGRIIAYLVSDLYEQAAGLKAEYKGGFKVTIFEQDESPRYLVEIITSVGRLSNEALEELADMLMRESAQCGRLFLLDQSVTASMAPLMASATMTCMNSARCFTTRSRRR